MSQSPFQAATPRSVCCMFLPHISKWTSHIPGAQERGSHVCPPPGTAQVSTAPLDLPPADRMT